MQTLEKKITYKNLLEHLFYAFAIVVAECAIAYV